MTLEMKGYSYNNRSGEVFEYFRINLFYSMVNSTYEIE
jgi:hypothetical protein